MLTFLVVDDSATIRATLKGSIANLRPADRIIEAETAEQALELIETEKPQVVFLDMMITDDGGGLDVAQEIIANAPDTRIVIVTGLAGDHPDVIKAISLGAFAYLQKPVRRHNVSTVLDEIDQEENRLHRIR